MADEGPTALSALPGGDYMAVDDVNQHVFVTGLPPAAPFDTNQTVEVLNFDGTVDTTLTVPGAEGMTIAKGNLYVAGCGSPTITVFDLATLTQTPPADCSSMPTRATGSRTPRTSSSTPRPPRCSGRTQAPRHRPSRSVRRSPSGW
jgi:hypothetical protein